MEYRKLGSSDLEVSEISLGSWLTYSGGVELDRTRACTDAAFEAGINFFDTANVYGRGAAETAWGEILSGRPRDSYVLATKVWGQMSDDPGDRAEPVDRAEQFVGEQRPHRVVHCAAGGARVGRRLLPGTVLAGQQPLGERRPHDLRDPVGVAEREELGLRRLPEHRVLRLRGDEQVGARDVDRRLDLLRRPLAEAEIARLARGDDLLERLDRLLDRDVGGRSDAPGRGRRSRSASARATRRSPWRCGPPTGPGRRGRRTSGPTPSSPARMSRAGGRRGSRPTPSRRRRGRRRWRCRRG